MEPVSTSVHHIFPSCQVSAQFRSGRFGITKKMDGECLKMVQTHGFSGALNWALPIFQEDPSSFWRSKGQLDIVELATCFLELGDEAALGTLPLSSLVYITRTEIGFFGIFTIFLVDWENISYWGSCGWSCHPLSRRTCLSHRRQPWQPLVGIAGGSWLTISCDGLLSKSIRILWQNQNIVPHFLHFFLALSLDSGGQPDVHRERQSNKQNSFCSFV